jgi:hypothetical protein
MHHQQNQLLTPQTELIQMFIIYLDNLIVITVDI